jgi:shikimate kinase
MILDIAFAVAIGAAFGIGLFVALVVTTAGRLKENDKEFRD